MTFSGGRGQTHATIFDPETLTTTDALIADTQHDMFCPGTAILPDGELLVTGGNNNRATTSYNPQTNIWSKEVGMNIPRGYHTSKYHLFCSW
jgi:galactose oxidase